MDEAKSINVADADSEKRIRKLGMQCVVAGFLCNFTVFGVGFTYGVFQEFYLSANGPLSHENSSRVAVIGTLATSITYLGGIFQGKIRKHILTFAAMAVGSILLSLGMVLASFCKETWEFAMTQGIMFGLGGSLVYLPPVVYCPQYFDKHRGIAMGILFSGTGFGSLVFAFLTRALTSGVGWKWALRILGFIALAITMTCSFLVHPHPNYKVKNKSIWSQLYVFKSGAFYLQMSCALFQSMGYLIPLVFMSTYGVTLGFTSNQGATFIGINNVANACSKIVLGHAADYIGRFNMQLLCCAASMITIYALWLVPERGTFLAFVVLYGVALGPIISLLPACVTEAFGVEAYYSVSGLLYLFRGVGNMLGSPIGGLLIEGKGEYPRSYFNAIQYTGAVLAVATVCSVLCTVAQRLDKHHLKTTA